MKILAVIIFSASIIGCNSSPDNVQQENLFESKISFYQASCEKLSSSRITSHELSFQVGANVNSQLVEDLFEAAKLWNLSIESVSVVNEVDSYNGQMILASCEGNDSREVIASAINHYSGIALNHSEILLQQEKSFRVALLAHELGHNLGLPDSEEDGIMNPSAVNKGLRKPSEVEFNQAQSFFSK